MLRVVVAAFFLVWVGAAIRGALPPRKLIKWRAPEGAASAAAGERRPILYDFSATWCEPCKEMDRRVFSSAEVAGFINDNFVPVRVADEDQTPAADAARNEYRVASLPTLLVAHAAKGELSRIEGFHDNRKTLAFLKIALVQGQSVGVDDGAPSTK